MLTADILNFGYISVLAKTLSPSVLLFWLCWIPSGRDDQEEKTRERKQVGLWRDPQVGAVQSHARN